MRASIVMGDGSNNRWVTKGFAARAGFSDKRWVGRCFESFNRLLSGESAGAREGRGRWIFLHTYLVNAARVALMQFPIDL